MPATGVRQGGGLLSQLVLVAVVLTAPYVAAQSPTATISGTVVDIQGAPIPGVAVTARHVATNRSFAGLSSQEGVYVITSLPVGRFEVTAALPGFKTFRQTDVLLEVGQRLRVDVTLELGGIDETVTVSAGGTRLQTEETSLGATVERERIENLPLNGRHVFNLVKIVPGVQPRFKDTDGFAEVDNQRFSRLSFNGGPLSSNQFFLDGGMNMIPAHYEISTGDARVRHRDESGTRGRGRPRVVHGITGDPDQRAASVSGEAAAEGCNSRRTMGRCEGRRWGSFHSIEHQAERWRRLTAAPAWAESACKPHHHDRWR